MRKFILFCLSAVTALFTTIGLMSCNNCSSCNDVSWFAPEDSAEIARIATTVNNPSFDSSIEFVKYANFKRSELEADLLLVTLNDVTLATLADVVHKRDGVITKKSIVEEYRKHPDIYSAISSNAARKETGQSLPEDSSAITNSGGSGDGTCN